MTANLSKLLNALGLVAIDTVLVVAFADQLWFRDLPCPVCILQRAGFIAAAFGIALNLIYGPRPSHYGIAILGAVAGAIVSAWQTLVYVVPGSGSYGNTILGLHLYAWAFLMFALIVAGSAVMLLFDRQFTPTEPLPARLRLLPMMAIALLLLLALANVVSTLAICGFGVGCPERPGGYLIINDNLSVTLLGEPS